ncbi:MAG: hypothetical protein WBM41_07870 [Arenicellales bacterium]
MDEFLDPVLSSRRTSEEPTRGLLPLTTEQQKFALHWTDVVRKSNSEMAYQFVSHAPKAIRLMGIDGTRQWLLDAMDIYDKEGLYPGSASLDALESFAAKYRLSHISVSLDQIRGVLETFICGLAGRTLKLEAGNSIYTDTNTLYLPASINRFNDREKNYQLFKATAVHLWAQTWFGTFKRPSPNAPHLVQQIAEFPDNGRALKLFNLLETVRLNACIRRELPGLAREMLTLNPPVPLHDATWKHYFALLESEGAMVADTIAATEKLYALQTPWPDALLYQAGFDLEAAQTGIEQRLEQEKLELQMLISDMMKQVSQDQEFDPEGMEDGKLEMTQDPKTGSPQLTLDGEQITAPSDIDNLLQSMLQDLDDLPEDWLVPAGDGGYRPQDESRNPEDVWKGAYHEEGAFLYDEWDYRRQTFRKNWCVLREMPTHPVYDDFYQKTIERYHHLVGEIRRHFEALRGEDKILKAEPVGDNVDIDALITAYADMQTGVEMSDRLFTRKQKIDRDLAVVFMVDVSGSTKGWINDAERESLILLCEALEILGDQYSIYGFSGMTRNRCEVYKIKTFDQPYDNDVRARISGLRPQDYTRMGVTIRHLTCILNQVEAKTRILITLSDGKPDDYDGYRGDYGIEDTRQALLEARNTGIHPFCITIDTEAGEYLPHMYGPASYVVVDEVRKLPLKVADIYRKLTT